MTIQLTDEEASLLREILQEQSRRLQLEVCHTDRRDYRRFLREREAILATIERKLFSTAPEYEEAHGMAERS